MDERIPRGERKLEAALERFGVAAAVRGARAIDVGASTGGFTRALLAHGAGSVAAVDVGHGQLRADVAADPRVTVFERVDFKRAPLGLVPGPFDFFTVDVSFVAARSQLRGLAFRLRAGAEGIVLLKPQFELASAEVRRRGTADPSLRAKALATFRAKAEALAFDVVAAADSPVPGAKGTVEILVHLRFRGPAPERRRTGEDASEGEAEGEARAPTTQVRRARSERDATAPAAAAAPVADATLEWFAVAAPGLEEALGAELVRLARDPAAVRVVDGGVELRGSLTLGLTANLWSRIATRVLLRVGRVHATDFSRLRRQAERLPWERYVGPGRTLRVRAACSRCRLFHTGAVAENVEAAIGDRVRRRLRGAGGAAAQAALPPLDVLVRGVDDRFTLSVDASGELLHRRGFRLETARAPLRETLAAGVLALCGWDGTEPLVDPLCGAGTVAIEAARLARRMAPGLDRTFAFETWPCCDRTAWSELVAEARAAVLPSAPVAIVAADRDAAALRATERNADRAGVRADLRIERREVRDLAPPAGPGLVVLDPPYGRRLGDERSARRLYRELGAVLRERWGGWRVGVLVPSRALARELGLDAIAEHRVTSGGLRLTLVRAVV